VVRFGLDVDDEAFQVEPEVVVRDREFPHLAALCNDERETSPLMVEVSVLDSLQRPLADAVVEQQPECDAVAQVVILGEKSCPVLRRDGLAVYVSFLRPFDREGRIALDVPAQLVVPEEVVEN
jgi:hypothetical protein